MGWNFIDKGTELTMNIRIVGFHPPIPVTQVLSNGAVSPISTVSRALKFLLFALTLVHAAENKALISEDRNLEVYDIVPAGELRQFFLSSGLLSTWLLVYGAFVPYIYLSINGSEIK